MRRALSRTAAVMTTALLTAFVLPTGVASAATTDDCVRSRSLRLFSAGTNDEDRLWVDYPSPTRAVVCFRMGSMFTGGLTIVVDTASTITLPNVVVGSDPSLCPEVIRDISDPIDLRLAIGLATTSVCITLEGTTTSLRFIEGNVSGALPVMEIWHDGGPAWGWFDVLACPVEYVIAVQFGGPTTCMSTNSRIL